MSSHKEKENYNLMRLTVDKVRILGVSTVRKWVTHRRVSRHEKDIEKPFLRSFSLK